MFENERSHLVSVALGANRELTGGSSHLVTGLGAVRIVTVAAQNQPLVHTMVEGHAELGLLLQMAGIAKLRLSFYQQEFLGLRMVR